MKLTQAEIARQARDTSHLEPDPVLCRSEEFVCTACGDSEWVDEAFDLELPWEWMGKHRGRACQRQALATAKAPAGLPTGEESSGDGRRVLGAKDSKDGGPP